MDCLWTSSTMYQLSDSKYLIFYGLVLPTLWLLKASLHAARRKPEAEARAARCP